MDPHVPSVPYCTVLIYPHIVKQVQPGDRRELLLYITYQYRLDTVLYCAYDHTAANAVHIVAENRL